MQINVEENHQSFISENKKEETFLSPFFVVALALRVTRKNTENIFNFALK
jgi:hypothetical protein